MVFDATIAALAGILYYPLPNIFENRDIYYSIMLLKTYLPSHISLFLCFLYYVTIPVLGIMMVNNTFTLIHCIFEVKYQIVLLNEVIRIFINDLKNFQKNDYLKNEYQDLIFQRLQFYIQHHIIAKR